MAAVIQPAVLRDASYVMANLRQADLDEVMCQVPDGMKRHELAYNLLMSGDAFTASVKERPVAFFGTCPINVACLSVWAIGTVDVWRAVPAINRFLTDVHLPDRIDQGYLTMEARSMETHVSAHRWLTAVGGVQHGDAYEFGKGREKFLTFRWTADRITAIRNKCRRP